MKEKDIASVGIMMVSMGEIQSVVRRMQLEVGDESAERDSAHTTEGASMNRLSERLACSTVLLFVG